MRALFNTCSRILGILALILLAGCGSKDIAPPVEVEAVDFPGTGLGKNDVFGRALVGPAAEYEADLLLNEQTQSLISDMKARREMGWNIVSRVLDSVPLLGLEETDLNEPEVELAPGEELPHVPRWQTWYGVDDFKRIFRHLYGKLTPEDRVMRRAFNPEELDEAFKWNATSLERSERWPLERFFKHVQSLGVCEPKLSEEECALSLQSNFSGAAAGNARITYSPATLRHILKNYPNMLQCLGELEALAMTDTSADSDENFTECLSEEFPPDAVLTKAHWVRADFGRTLRAFDTDGESLKLVTGPNASANWAEGDREVDPGSEDIFTIRMRNGDTYRLAGLHIMTKELRHWVWITLWWSDKPNEDYGADRPEIISALEPVWSNYKMGVVVDYLEQDPDPAGHYPELPSLASALEAVQSEITWLSNPYIEHGRGNARTNCIGCHQHGGSLVGFDLDDDGNLDSFDLERVIDDESLFPSNGRTQIRTIFPSDYLWSTSRVDNLRQILSSEVSNFDAQDKLDPAVRALSILQLESSEEAGAETFQRDCTPCHGGSGEGTDTAPALSKRVPSMNDQELTERLILGKGAMPEWSHFSDQSLSDLRAFLRSSFGF